MEITPSPKLSFSLQQGWEPFSAAMTAVGSRTVAKWVAHRLGDSELADSVEPLIAEVVDPDSDDMARLESLSAIAELGDETEDDLLADACWEGVASMAMEIGDADAVAEATARLSAIAEQYGDFLAAAEHHLTFLNWRRSGEASSDPEAVEIAFDEVIRLAERDGAQRARAEWAFRQAAYTRLVEAEDERAVIGDWEQDTRPYTGWE